MTKKKLPDHNVSSDNTLVKFPTDQIERLRSDFRFRSSYPLAESLDNVSIFFEKKQYFDPPPKVGAQRKLLSTIVESGTELKTALRRLGQSELMLISRTECEWGRQESIDEISNIVRPVKFALTDLAEQPRRYRPKRDTERRLIARLLKIYQEGTGQSDRYSQDPDSHEYSGNLIRFIEEIITYFPVSISNEFLGDTLKTLFSSKG